MRVFVTGATGFVGRAVVLRLLRDGHSVVTWTRNTTQARAVLGADVDCVALQNDDSEMRAALANADAVVNLAGTPVLPKRWTPQRKRVLTHSRVQLTDRLVNNFGHRRPPQVFISASAIGYYGDAKDAVLTEQSAAGSDFLARLCVDWEAQASLAQPLGSRVVLLRLGLVIGPEGGFLQPLLRQFVMGFGGRLGSGKQWMSFIHRDDLAELVATALVDERYQGPVNAVMPQSVTNTEFTQILGQLLHRPVLASTPASAIKLALGEASNAVLGSQRVLPTVLGQNGFSYAFESLTPALRDVLDQGDSVFFDPAKGLPDAEYIRRRRPTFRLTQRTVLFRPRHEVFQFFSKASNLGAMTPSFLSFAMTSPPPPFMQAGTVIDHRIKVAGIGMRWRTHVERWNPESGFVDVQHKGPYRAWWHEHRFVAEGEHTIMQDTVYYALPLGVLGRMAHRWVVMPMLRRIFGYRAAAVRLRFGSPTSGPREVRWYKDHHATSQSPSADSDPPHNLPTH